jgi:DHA1 family tetracycline resistance protein-like MFS transporter
VVFGLAPVAWIFLAGVPFLCLGGLAGPPAQAMMTQQVDAHEQGRLQGALTSLASLAGIFGPALFANIFALFISDHAPTRLPGAAFLLSALLLLVSAVIAARITQNGRIHPSPAGDDMAPVIPFKHFTPEPVASDSSELAP